MRKKATIFTAAAVLLAAAAGAVLASDGWVDRPWNDRGGRPNASREEPEDFCGGTAGYCPMTGGRSSEIERGGYRCH
jgi:hypothetical protein